MSRTLLLGAGSSIAFFALQSAASAQPFIYGGGSSLVANDVGTSANITSPVPNSTTTEFGLFNMGSLNGSPAFVYLKSGSGAGRNAVLTNNENCNVANLAFPNTCSAPAVAPVAFGNSDGLLSSSEIAFAATKSAPAVNTVYGDLIQIPFLGTGVAIPVINPKVTADGAVVLKDSDLCGIFSGKITNWSMTSAASKLTAGTIQVAFRQDSSGTTFLFTNHLGAKDTKITVCTSSNTASGVTFAPVNSFVDQFPTKSGGIFNQAVADNSVPPVTHYVPANFHPETGSSAVASYLATQTSAIGYISPDFTHIVLGGTNKLFDAAINVSGNTPSVANIETALSHVTTTNPLNTNQTPPTAATANDPTKWVPTTSTVSSGYSIVGYTNIVLPQCFSSADASIEANLSTFLGDHYNVASYQTIQTNNGFVPLAKIPGTAYLTAVKSFILNSGAATGLQSTSFCAGFTGR